MERFLSEQEMNELSAAIRKCRSRAMMLFFPALIYAHTFADYKQFWSTTSPSLPFPFGAYLLFLFIFYVNTIYAVIPLWKTWRFLPKHHSVKIISMELVPDLIVLVGTIAAYHYLPDLLWFRH